MPSKCIHNRWSNYCGLCMNERNKIAKEATANELLVDRPEAEELSERDIAKQRLAELLGAHRHQINEWETKFCESVLNFLLRYPSRDMSEKQAAVLQKTWNKYNEDNGADPTPKGNPTAQFAKPQPRNTGFDDYDDDIPF